MGQIVYIQSNINNRNISRQCWEGLETIKGGNSVAIPEGDMGGMNPRACDVICAVLSARCHTTSLLSRPF